MSMDEPFDTDPISIRRARVLRPILEIERSGLSISRALSDAAWELDLSRNHVRRLYNRLKAEDGKASALIRSRAGPIAGSRRLPDEVEILIRRILQERYLVREAPSFLRIVGEIRAECAAKGFRMPTRRTIKSRLDAMDAREVLKKRNGVKAASQVYSARVGRLHVEQTLDVVQIDHTTADVMLVDHVDRKPLKRPYLTLAVDVASRVVLGFYVSFDAPSVLSIALCLNHCLEDKTIPAGEDQDDLAWPTAGIPKAIHVDNAQEFKSRAFRTACDEWGIEVTYRPYGGTHYGGHIERLIGTTMGAVHVLPGTTMSSPKEKGDYDSVAEAALTLSEFQDWLSLEICRYHNTVHGGLGRTPLAAWADLTGGKYIQPVSDRDGFRISFMPFERRKVRRTGIRLFSIDYWNDALTPLVGRIDHSLVIKYDPRDLSRVWALVPDGRVIEARYKDLNRPRISWWEFRRARKEFNETRGGQMSEAALFYIIQIQRRIAEAARQKTQASRLDAERNVQLPKSPKRRDPSRAMFAVDTSNPDLPKYDMDGMDDT